MDDPSSVRTLDPTPNAIKLESLFKGQPPESAACLASRVALGDEDVNSGALVKLAGELGDEVDNTAHLADAGHGGRITAAPRHLAQFSEFGDQIVAMQGLVGLGRLDEYAADVRLVPLLGAAGGPLRPILARL